MYAKVGIFLYEEKSNQNQVSNVPRRKKISQGDARDILMVPP